MDKIKGLLRKIAFPPIGLRWIFSFSSFLLVAAVFIFSLEGTAVSYAAYLLSAIGLYYFVTVTLVPLIRKLKAILLRNKYIKRYYEDKAFNARVSLYRSTAFNILYAIFKLISGILYRSFWMIAIAFYYIVLISIRFVLIRRDSKILLEKENAAILTEWKGYRLAGWLMLLLDIAFSGIVVQVVEQNRGYSYPGNLIFLMAAYAFYSITAAIIRLLKGRRERSPIFSAAKAIDVSVAVVAMFTLQTAMFASFSAGINTRAPNMIAGTAAAMVVTAIAITMIVRASGNIRGLQAIEEAEKK